MDNCIEVPFAGPLTANEFQSLPEELVRNVLDYIPLVERIKFERVDSLWAAFFNDMWLVRKRLAFCFGHNCSIVPETKCRIKDHEFVEMDIVHLHDQDGKKLSGLVIQRCPGLKALHIRCHNMKGEVGELLSESMIARILNEKCLELEHIEGNVNGFPFLFKFEPKNAFRCYHVVSTQPIICADEFFRKWTHLKMNSVNTSQTMFSALKLPSFAELEVLHCTSKEWVMFENGVLSKLKVLKLYSASRSIGSEMESYESIKNLHLEELLIYINSTTDNYLEHILSSNNLKVLELHYLPLGLLHFQPNVPQTYQLKQILKLVSKFAPNLTQFSLWIEPGTVELMDTKCWVEIAKLAKLRVFSLKSVTRCRPHRGALMYHGHGLEADLAIAHANNVPVLNANEPDKPAVIDPLLQPIAQDHFNDNKNCTERKQKLFDGVQLLLLDANKLRSIKLDYKACYEERDLELWCRTMASFGEEHPKRRIKFYVNENRIVNDNFKEMVASNVYLFTCPLDNELKAKEIMFYSD